MLKLNEMIFDTPDAERDQHVRDYYSQPANDFEHLSSSKFINETVACAVAYETSLNGCAETFGDVNEAGFYARVLFDAAPFIVCFVENSDGFVTEITNRDYESFWAQDVEQREIEEGAELWEPE